MAITYDERKGQLSLDDELVADLYLLDDQMYLIPLWIVAPDLLAACEAALDWIDRYGADGPGPFGGEAEIAGQLRAAVAKVRGER